MKRIILAALVSLVLAGCAQTAYWVKKGGSSDEFDRTQAACHNQAFFLPQTKFEASQPGYKMTTQVIGNLGFSTITPYKNPYQNLGDAIGSLGAAFADIGRKELFLENCMIANGWKKATENMVSVTSSVYAVVGPNKTVYEGSATGHLDRTGTMKVKNASGNACVGSFRYTAPMSGDGLLRCDDGDSTKFTFFALTNLSGYGDGTSVQGKKVNFVYGIDGKEREKYLGGASIVPPPPSTPTPTATSPAIPSASTAKPATTAKQSSAKASIENRLKELKKLLDKGLLTPDEAAEKRKEILNSL